MKKLLVASLSLLVLVGCDEKKATNNAALIQNDSLQQIIQQRDDQLNEMMATMNQIQDGFRLINEAENRVSIAKDGESTNKAQQIKENMQFIAQRMEENRALLKKLRTQLNESTFKGDQLKKTVENLMRQLDEKNQELQQLRAELDAKDIHITELDEAINTLNSNVSDLKNENTEKAETISNQDKQLNTAWFVFGTKSELKEQKILVDGKVLQSNFNKSYFSKIDIRVDKEIKLYSKSAKLLTMHPSSSYTLTQDENKQYVLRISHPDIFWSTSKYLVVLVK
ncbi:MAG: hypothetical protein MR536_00025 [Prevotella sp.]|nr:hypothetical protein [Prevotella sp.]MDD7462831.1 hypothetical protein [Prevotellaceae bacterium]MDY3366398.1 hypothetical protein [Prevotella sp.]MDY3851726.1 hypothetical protein [Prevotella sp.]